MSYKSHQSKAYDLDVTLNKNSRSKLSLAGEDILPRKYSERTITPNKLITIWFAMAVEITLFMSAAQLYDSLTVLEIIFACFIGHTLLFSVMWVTQDIGIKYGISFPVALRPSFGYVGSLIAAYFRAIPAIFWFGFQTWVAASAINGITNAIWGLNNLVLWIMVLGVIQIAHTTLGIKAVSRLSNLATPLLLIVGFYILYIAFTDYGLSFSNVWGMKGTGEGSYSLMYAAMSFMGGWATLSISIMDITRDCVSDAEQVKSFKKVMLKYLPPQWIGIIPAVVFYTFIGVIGVATTGHSNPAEILVALSQGHSEIMMVLCLIFIAVATWCTNDTANLFPAGYAISSTFPSKINFAKGIIIAGLVGLVSKPWAAADSLVDVMVIIGNLLAPVAGIMISDYFFLRKRTINIDALYDADGQYKYWKNINPAAFIALIVGTIISWPFGDFAFFVGLISAAVLYYYMMKLWIIKKYPQPEIED
ncbi:MAG: cytosine permease [Clostridia bacterium]|jgi:NCS1 family nucleobase:cation symporter-1